MKYLILTLASIMGCSVQYTTKPEVKKTEVKKTEVKVKEPVLTFRGKSADPITWDLRGNWTISGVGDNGPRFEESWHLKKSQIHNDWIDPLRGETFDLKHTKNGDFIIWTRYSGRQFIFSVNEQSYGLLQLTDEADSHYLVIRRD